MPHDEDDCIAVSLLEMLIPALIRSGDIREETIMQLADEMDHEAQSASVRRTDELERMSAALRFYAIEASGPTVSEWKADRRRNRFRVIEGDEKP